MTIEKLQSDNYSSRTRNRAIARAFKEAGIIERYGSGIARIQNECTMYGVMGPNFEEFVHDFRVTLYKEKLHKDNVVVTDMYEFIKNNQPVKASIIAENLNNVTQRTIERWIKQLKDEDKIEFRGAPKTGGYFVKGTSNNR